MLGLLMDIILDIILLVKVIVEYWDIVDNIFNK